MLSPATRLNCKDSGATAMNAPAISPARGPHNSRPVRYTNHTATIPLITDSIRSPTMLSPNKRSIAATR